MKRILLIGFAMSLLITVSSCRESADEKSEEVMEETSMEAAPAEGPVEIQEEVVVDSAAVSALEVQ